MCQVLDPLKFPASGFTPTQNLLIQPLPRGERREEVRDCLLYHRVWVLPYRSPPHPVKGHVGQAGMEAKSIEWLSGSGGRGNAKKRQAGLLLCHSPGLRIIVSLFSVLGMWRGEMSFRVLENYSEDGSNSAFYCSGWSFS